MDWYFESVRIKKNFLGTSLFICPSQWPRGLRRRSRAARLLRLWVRIPPGAWMSVCCECCVLSGRGLCDELITRPEKSYRLWCVVMCDLEISRLRRPWPTLGRSATEGGKNSVYLIPTSCIFVQQTCILFFPLLFDLQVFPVIFCMHSLSPPSEPHDQSTVVLEVVPSAQH